MIGLVVKNTGSDYSVLGDDGKLVQCKIKGNFRIKGIKSTNPIAIGDRVEYDDTGYIFNVLKRKNYIVRRPTNLSKQLHILAANIDQAVLVVTIKNPETAFTFIDRFLATAEAYGIPAYLVFNKIDLLTTPDDQAELQAAIDIYERIGYKCLKLSATEGNGIEELRTLCSNHLTLLSGNSGVGKSTIINLLIPDAKAYTSEISAVHLKGMHTTTFSEMYMGENGLRIIDTPGIKGFGVVDMKPEEVGHYFPEIFEASKQCWFHNCTHQSEPNCAVIKAVEEHRIAMSRFLSYLSIIEDANEKKYR